MGFRKPGIKGFRRFHFDEVISRSSFFAFLTLVLTTGIWLGEAEQLLSWGWETMELLSWRLIFFCLHGGIVHESVLYLSSHRLISERGEGMLQNNIELDLKTRLIESGLTQTEVAEKVGVSLAYVNRITKGREQIVNKTFVKMMDELGYDVELTYKKKAAE